MHTLQLNTHYGYGEMRVAKLTSYKITRRGRASGKGGLWTKINKESILLFFKPAHAEVHRLRGAEIFAWFGRTAGLPALPAGCGGAVTLGYR